jgi:hypothetical protein
MPTENELEQLSSKELHDLAVSHARRHVDVKFFWNLLKYLPVAEAGAGKLDEAEADLQSTIAHVDDITESGEGEVAENLRPFYIQYLQEHDVSPSDAG